MLLNLLLVIGVGIVGLIIGSALILGLIFLLILIAEKLEKTSFINIFNNLIVSKIAKIIGWIIVISFCLFITFAVGCGILRDIFHYIPFTFLK